MCIFSGAFFCCTFSQPFHYKGSEWNTSSLRTKRNAICNIQKPRCLIAVKRSVEKLGLSQYCMRCLKIHWIMCVRNVPIMLGGGEGHWSLTQQPSHLLGKTNTEKFGVPTVTECLRRVWKWITWHDVGRCEKNMLIWNMPHFLASKAFFKMWKLHVRWCIFC